MNITLSADDELVRKVGELPREEAAREFETVARSMAGNSRSRGGTAWHGREKLYAERMNGIARE